MAKLELARVGCDVVAVRRLRTLRKSAVALHRLLRPEEFPIGTNERLAGILAVKEAAMKALGLPPGSWLDICVSHEASGRPRLTVSGRYARRVRGLDCSIAHDGGIAMAVVVAYITSSR